MTVALERAGPADLDKVEYQPLQVIASLARTYKEAFSCTKDFSWRTAAIVTGANFAAALIVGGVALRLTSLVF